MKINFKQPRYMLPLVVLPFLCLFFYVYKSSFGKEEPVNQKSEALQENVAEVSDEVKKRSLQDKLDAYRNQYKDGDGYTAVGVIGEESQIAKAMPDLYNQQEKKMLDSIDRAMKQRYGPGAEVPRHTSAPPRTSGSPSKGSDQEIADAIARLKQTPPVVSKARSAPSDDPMLLFREQMRLIDSMGKANNPEYRKEQARQKAIASSEQEKKDHKVLPVSRAYAGTALFNTVTPQREETPIQAIIDEDMTGFAGSRLRIRLLDDLMAGNFLVKKGTYIYAQITGFSGQRVSLSVTSIMQSGRILPVRLQLYDNDGLPGIYVPASAFREFTKELGGNASQGVTIQQQAENNNQLVMSMLQRMFQSTSTAVNKLIRSNKAKFKYNTLVYLIDPDQLKTDHR